VRAEAFRKSTPCRSCPVAWFCTGMHGMRVVARARSSVIASVMNTIQSRETQVSDESKE
jgi:hypothetical protein